MARPSIRQLEEVLGPAAEWVGRCYAIASACIQHGFVKGVAVYGHWLGPVHPLSPFKDRADAPFVRHGWVVTTRDLIFDPTRWAFTAQKPFIYRGPNGGEYDEGGNQVRKARLVPPPRFDPDASVFKISDTLLSSKPWAHLEKLLGDDYAFDLGDAYSPGDVTLEQLLWVANLPYEDLQPYAREIYQMLDGLGHRALIPVDNYRRANR